MKLSWSMQGIFALILGVFLPVSAWAASSLQFTPASGSYLVDEVVPVRVSVDSPEKLSAIEATIQFDPINFDVSLLSTSAEVSWIAAPVVDTEKGEIYYSGMLSKTAILPLDVLTLRVKGIRPGKHELRFVSGASTVAADGTGGNTLGKITHAQFDILTEEGFVSPDGEVLGLQDEQFIIRSSEIVDPAKWYAFHQATLEWTLPERVQNVLLGLTKKHDDVGYKPGPKGTTTRTLTDLEEGEWYFHLTPEGKGKEESVHFRIAIDREAPLIGTTTIMERADVRDPNISVFIEAEDVLSGISHYEFLINGNHVAKWEDDGTHQYRFKSPVVGNADLTISAFDHAGNRSEVHIPFRVEPLPVPSIVLQKDSFGESSPIIADVIGLPSAVVKIVFEGDRVRQESIINLDHNGRGRYVLRETLLPGAYQLHALQTLDHGGSSEQPIITDVIITPSIAGYIGRNFALSLVLIPILFVAFLYGFWRFGVIHVLLSLRRRKKSILRTPPALPVPTSSSPRTKVVSSSLQVKKSIRTHAHAGVVDLRKK